MNITKVAWRNIWRNPRRSLVTMSTMTVALCALLILAGLMQGMMNGLEHNIVDLETGDLQIFAPGYEQRPSLYLRIADPASLLIRLDAAGYPATARLRASGLAAAGDSSAGALIVGVDVVRDRRVSRVDREVAAGRWLDPADAKGVVIGRRLARSLGLSPGGEILLLSNGADGSMANELYTVRGVLNSMGEAIDRAGVFMNEGAWRALLVVPDGAHQIIVRRPATVPLAAARATVARLVAAEDVRTWQELMPIVANIMETQRSSMVVLYLIVYVAVGIVILNAMMMSVFERIRELGVLKAVGMKPASVFALVVVEGAWQTAIALALGVALATPALFYLARHGINVATLAGVNYQGMALDPQWHAAVGAGTFSGPIVMLLVVVALAMTFPALKAARLQPVDAMRYR